MLAGLWPPDVGGPATQAWHLCRALRRAGVDVVVVSLGGPRGLASLDGVPVHRLGLQGSYGWARRKAHWLEFAIALRRILARERPEILHCHDVFLFSLMAGAIARARGIPSVAKYAGDMVWEVVNAGSLRAPTFEAAYRADVKARLLYRLQRAGLRSFDLVWAASEYQRNRLLALGVPDRRIRVLPNLISLPQAEPAAADDASADDPPTVLTASRLVPHKRLELMLDVFARVGPPARLTIVGDGPGDIRARLRARAAHLGLAGRVELTGALPNPEVLRHMRRATVYASTSIWEGFGIVFVEAMAVGLPIVAMRVGALPEVVPDGQAGYLVAPDDPAAMAARLRELLDDPGRRRTMAAFACGHARQFDIDAGLGRFLDLYRDARARAG